MSSRDPAPGRLEVLRGFVNSLDVEDGTEALSSPGATSKWLASSDLIEVGTNLDEDDVTRLKAVREALRALLATNAGHTLEPGAVELLNREAGRASLRLEFDDSGRAALESASSGTDDVVARLLAIVHEAVLDGTWVRLKVCLNDECQWAFYDRSKNRSGRWCTMDDCGNVMKARAYRRRTHAET
jgi:predicted RNA-binding Zn ribbon-like protein